MQGFWDVATWHPSLWKNIKKNYGNESFLYKRLWFAGKFQHIWADEFPYPSLKSKRVRQSEWLKSQTFGWLKRIVPSCIPEVDFWGWITIVASERTGKIHHEFHGKIHEKSMVMCSMWAFRSFDPMIQWSNPIFDRQQPLFLCKQISVFLVVKSFLVNFSGDWHKKPLRKKLMEFTLKCCRLVFSGKMLPQQTSPCCERTIPRWKSPGHFSSPIVSPLYHHCSCWH